MNLLPGGGPGCLGPGGLWSIWDPGGCCKGLKAGTGLEVWMGLGMGVSFSRTGLNVWMVLI